MEKDAKYERELKQQRRIMTMLLNKERMRKRESNKSSDTSKIEKTIDKASKELTKLTEEEIRLNEKLLDAINKGDKTSIKQLREDLKRNKEEKKSNKDIKDAANKILDELENANKLNEEGNKSLSAFNDSIDSLRDTITAFNVGSITSQLSDDVASTKDLYRSIGNNLNMNWTDVKDTIGSSYKDIKDLYSNAFSSTEYAQYVSDLVDNGQRNLDIAKEMAGYLGTMDKTLGISASSLATISTFTDSDTMKSIGDNLVGLQGFNKIDFDRLVSGIDANARTIESISQQNGVDSEAYYQALLKAGGTLENNAIDTTTFFDNLNTFMATSNTNSLAEDYGYKSVQLANQLRAGNVDYLNTFMEQAIKDANTMNSSAFKSIYGDTFDDNFIRDVKNNALTLDSWRENMSEITNGINNGDMLKSAETLESNLSLWDKFFNKNISGSWLGDIMESDIFEGFSGGLIGGSILTGLKSLIGGAFSGGAATEGAGLLGGVSSSISGLGSSVLGGLKGFLGKGLAGAGVAIMGSSIFDKYKRNKEGREKYGANFLYDDDIVSKIKEESLKQGYLSDNQKSTLDSMNVNYSDWGLENVATSTEDLVSNTEETTSIISKWYNEWRNPTTKASSKYSTFNVDGSHKNGLDEVPFDGYIAELHKGERVLTARETKAYDDNYEKYIKGLNKNALNTLKFTEKITDAGVLQAAISNREAYAQALSNMSNSANDSSLDSSSYSDLSGSDFLGKVSAKYEITYPKHRGDFISDGDSWGDPGGTSYGVPQFATRTGSAKSFAKWISNRVNTNIGNLTPDTNSFNTEWKAIANKIGIDKFEKLQGEYAYNQFGKPFENKWLRYTGLSLKNRGFQEMLYSAGIQHGSGTAKKYSSGITSSMSDTAIVDKFYDNRATLNSTSGTTRANLADRFKRERVDVKALLNQPPAYEQGTPYVPSDQLALLHKGEMVVPAKNNPLGDNSASIPIKDNNNDDVVNAINDLKVVLKQAIEFIGKKMDNKETVIVDRTPIKRRNTLNDKYLESLL